MKARVARIAVRAGDKTGAAGEGSLILGLTHNEVFKPGHVYEIVEIMGEHIIRDLGLSAATVCIPRYGPSWNHDVNTLVGDGRHLLSVSEFGLKSVLHARCSNCGHEGLEHRPDFKCLFGTTYYAQKLED